MSSLQEPASEAYHESKALSEGTTLAIELTDVGVFESDESHLHELHFRFICHGTKYTIKLTPDETAELPYQNILSHLQLPNKYTGYQSLKGTTQELYVNFDAGIVRDPHSMEQIGTVNKSFWKEWNARIINNVKNQKNVFDLRANAERTVYQERPDTTSVGTGTLRTRETEHDQLEMWIAEDPHDHRWTFDIPAPSEHDTSALTRLVTNLDIGGPNGLDGERVMFAPEYILEEKKKLASIRTPDDEGGLAVFQDWDEAKKAVTHEPRNHLVTLSNIKRAIPVLLFSLVFVIASVLLSGISSLSFIAASTVLFATLASGFTAGKFVYS